MTLHEFAVWAPRPERVRLDVDGALHPMTRSDDGWWRADRRHRDPTPATASCSTTTRRCCRIPARPASPTACTSARSCGDPLRDAWTDDDWAGRSIEGAVIYELHVGTFTPAGTFDSAIEKLDYLVDLGVDFVELMPVNAFGGTHGWGYDGVLWYAVHEPYGGPDGLVRFVDACHRRGLGVLIDAVFNHLGPSGNYLPRFGPYLSSGSNPWGEASTSPTPTPTRCGATSSTARCAGCATSTPTGCGWTPCTRWSTPPPSTSSRSWPPKPMRWQRNWAGRCR